MSNLLKTAAKQAAAATPTMAAAIADVEGAKLGAAAERKRIEESDESLSALLQSEDQGGKGVRWERRIRANGEVRHVAMIERAGAYSERSFLAACRRAARSAGKGRLRWDGDAVESIAAELCLSVLSRTAGRMPRKGSLGQRTGFESADDAYLTATAARLIADALSGERRRAGLSAEIDAMAAADGAEVATGADLLAESVTAAESEQDRYMAESEAPATDSLPCWDSAEWERAGAIAHMAAQVLTPNVRQALRTVAQAIGQKPASVEAALVAALREREQAADLALSGYSTTPGAFRKAASTGRGILRTLWDYVPTDAEQAAAVEAVADALSHLCTLETADREAPHMGECNGPQPYRRPSIMWPDRTAQSGAEPAQIDAERLASYPGA